MSWPTEFELNPIFSLSTKEQKLPEARKWQELGGVLPKADQAGGSP